MSSILKASRTFLNLQLSSFLEFLILIAGTFVTGTLFWTNVYVSHAISVKRLAENPNYVFDLNQALIRPHVLNLAWVLVIAVPILAHFVVHRSEKLILIKSTATKTLFGKYLAVLALAVLILLPSSVGFSALQLLKGGLDSGKLFTAFLGLVLTAVLFSAVSIFLMIRIKNRNRAVSLALVLCAFLWLSGQVVLQNQRWLPFALIGEFSRGIVDIKTILVYLVAIWMIFDRTLFYAKKRRSGSKRRALAGLAVIAFLMILPPAVLRGIDLSETNQNFLSQQTVRVLKQFGREKILVTAFLPFNHAELKNIDNLLREYAYIDPDFQFKITDPDQNPKEALENRIDAYGATVVEAKGKRTIVSFPDENKITTALASFLEDRERRIFFVTGHNEPSLTDKGELGYENLAVKMESLRYRFEETGLMQIHDLLPQDLILLAGPHSDLSNQEIKILRRHFDSGGSVFIAADPVFPKEGERLRSFLWELGVDFGRDVIIDKFSKLQGTEKLALVVTDFGPHASIQNFMKPVIMPVTRSVRKRVNVPENIEVTEIARTGRGSWAETNLTDLENDNAELNEKEDIKGPIAVVCVLESEKSGGKMVVIGDSDWLVNSRIELLGNRDLFVVLIKWLLSERAEEKFVFRASSSAEKPFILSGGEQTVIFGTSVFFVPIILILGGFIKLVFSRV